MMNKPLITIKAIINTPITKVGEYWNKPESENPVEMQRNGWQSILNNFKKYTETNE